MASFETLQDKIVWGAITGMVTWLAFVTLQVMDSPSRGEVERIMETQTPYARERQLVQNQLDQLSRNEEKLGNLLSEITREVRQMRIEIERLLVIKPSDVFQKVEALERTIHQFKLNNRRIYYRLPQPDDINEKP